MHFLSPTNCYGSLATTNTAILQWTISSLAKSRAFGNNHLQKRKSSQSARDTNVVFCIRALARRKSVKKLRKSGDTQKDLGLESTDNEKLLDSESNFVKDAENDSSSINVASRSSVIQACVVTSGLIAALGIVIRQVSHVASVEGLPIIDCSSEVSFGFELWHVELVTGLVILISTCRYLLLKAWPDFTESSELANKQVLTSLELSDYVLVSLLPGVSEELLFRGALLPLFGMDWKSALFVAAIFGVLHLGGGRNSSFAIWATFVGLLYGYATIVSSSMVVPMAAHALNNMVGGILWRYSASDSSK